MGTWLELSGLEIPDGTVMRGCFWAGTECAEVIAHPCLPTCLSVWKLHFALRFCAIMQSANHD